jgi:hypothetical protein
VLGSKASHVCIAVSPDVSAKTRHQKIRLRKTQTRCGLPSKVLRLKTSPTVCFQQLAANFNLTMLRLNILPKRMKIERRPSQVFATESLY